MKTGKKRKTSRSMLRTAVFFLLLFVIVCPAQAASHTGNGQQTSEQKEAGKAEKEQSETETARLEEKKKETQEGLLEDMELEQMQEAVNELLGEETFSLQEALGRLLNGEELFSKAFLGELFRGFAASYITPDRDTLVQVLLLVLVAALFSNFTNVFGNGQTGEISFYVVYMLLLVLLLHSFGSISQSLADSLGGFITFMKALMPSYFLAVTAANGSASAMVFYEMALAVIFLVQVVLLKAVLPGIHAYVLLQMVNYLHNEDFLSKMAELLKTVLEWTLNTCTAAVIGMQIIQNMISPAVDSLKRDMLGKTAAAIPGVGNAINGVTEVALGTAVLIRNGLGVTGILVLLVLGFPPVCRLGMTTLLYKFLAALVQPISDKRMVGCLSTVGDGCRLLLRVLLTTGLLLLITIAILSVSFIDH